MNKLLAIALFGGVMALTVSQAQAATCYCRGKLFIGESCGSFGIGGNPGDTTYNLTDTQMKQNYLNTSIFLRSATMQTGERAGWLTGWVCWK